MHRPTHLRKWWKSWMNESTNFSTKTMYFPNLAPSNYYAIIYFLTLKGGSRRRYMCQMRMSNAKPVHILNASTNRTMWKISKYWRTIRIIASILKKTMFKNKIGFFLRKTAFVIVCTWTWHLLWHIHNRTDIWEQGKLT